MKPFSSLEPEYLLRWKCSGYSDFTLSKWRKSLSTLFPMTRVILFPGVSFVWFRDTPDESIWDNDKRMFASWSGLLYITAVQPGSDFEKTYYCQVSDLCI